MQQLQTLEYPVYWNSQDQICYDRTSMRNVFQHGRNCGNQEVSIQQAATKISTLNLPVMFSARSLDRTKGMLEEEETHNSPDISMDGWKHSIPRPSEVRDFPRCNIFWHWVVHQDTNRSTSSRLQRWNAAWAMREKVLLWNQPSPWQIVSFHIRMGRYEVAGRISGTEHWLLKTSFHPANSWISSGLRVNWNAAPHVGS